MTSIGSDTDVERELERLESDEGIEIEIQRGERAEIIGELNVGAYERYACGIGGGVMALAGLARLAGRHPFSGLLMMAAGTLLLRRGVSGYCNVYKALGIEQSDASPSSNPLSRSVCVKESIEVGKPASELYSWWRKTSNLESLAPWLMSVEEIDDKHSHWTAEVLGRVLNWKSAITEDVPNEMISWTSVPGADVETYGNVRFTPAPNDRGTVVDVNVSFRLPGGALGAVIAKVTGRDPGQLIRDALRVLKQVMETGERATVEGQPKGRCASSGKVRGA